MGCNDCESWNEGECKRHGPLVVVPDSPTLTKARQSLPLLLRLKRDPSADRGVSVFARTRVSCRTLFGPLLAPRKTGRHIPLVRGKLEFKVFRNAGLPVALNIQTSDERHCNWMVFVRAALISDQQNLVAFQYRAGIYFVSIREIKPGEELRVWYSKEYAFNMETRPLAKPSGRCRHVLSVALHLRRTKFDYETGPNSKFDEESPPRERGKMWEDFNAQRKNRPQFTRPRIRTSISPSSAVELNTTSALTNYATEADSPPHEEGLPTRQLRPRSRPEQQSYVCPICHHRLPSSFPPRVETRQQRAVCTCVATATPPVGSTQPTTPVTKTSRAMAGLGAKSVRKKRTKEQTLDISAIPSVEAGRKSNRDSFAKVGSPSSTSGETTANVKELMLASSRKNSSGSSVSTSVSEVREMFPSNVVANRAGKQKNITTPTVAKEMQSQVEYATTRPRSVHRALTSDILLPPSDISEPRESSLEDVEASFFRLENSSSNSSSGGGSNSSRTRQSLRRAKVQQDIYSNPQAGPSGLTRSPYEELPYTGSTPTSSRHSQRSFRTMQERRNPRTKKYTQDEDIVQQTVPERGFGSSQAVVGPVTPEATSIPRKPRGRHTCPVCTKSFGSPGKLRQHMYSHTGERPFHCTHPQCSKSFSSKFKLVRHELIHSVDRKFRCTICDRTFHRKDHLKNHVKVHSPIKKTFRCDREGCGKEYSSYLSFRKHSAVHAAEEGNLECKMCGRTFATKEEIVYHLKVHAGSRTVKNPSDKKYRCEHCDRKFFTRKDVRRHLVVHTGKRDFLCQYCPQRFGRKDHLVRHIKKSHYGGAVIKGKVKRQQRGGFAATSSTVPSISGAPTPKRSSSSILKSSVSKSSTYSPPAFQLSEARPSTSDEMLMYSPSEIMTLPSDLTLGGLLEGTQYDTESAVDVKSEPEEHHQSSTIHHRPQVLSQELVSSLMYDQPPPPYSSQLQQTPFKLFEPDNNEGEIKMEPQYPQERGTMPHPMLPTAVGGMDLNQFLSLLPSTSGSVDQDPSAANLLVQHLRRGEEELQRFLVSGSDGGSLLAGDTGLPSHLLNLISSSESLQLPGSEPSGSAGGVSMGSVTAPSGDEPDQSRIIASLLQSDEEMDPNSTPLPGFSQAFPQ
uniref:(California timema) hypothetical protein n=1 Tax=Timema californicum TaxID=61474 RepID=A0A7R9P4K8_TIMCA|nr:unnamed protein product [Timema californicum]